MFGFLNVYKPAGMTSHDVIARLRKVTKIKQIGHTGTLDPFAQGVLPVAIGKAARLIEFLDDDKEYLATVQLGAATTTYDLEGEVTFTSAKTVSEDEVREALKDFEGEILQTPPIYSAIKVNGKKLYDYARKGEAVAIEPRRVVIEKIELFTNSTLQSFNPSTIQLLIKCSKGTYIRSIAHDLGEKLGVGGHLTELMRSQAGKFTVENAIPLDELDTIEKVRENLINPLELLNCPHYEITEQELEKVRHGQCLVYNSGCSKRCIPNYTLNKLDLFNNVYKEDDLLVLVYNKEVAAIACAQGDKLIIKKVFL